MSRIAVLKQKLSQKVSDQPQSSTKIAGGSAVHIARLLAAKQVDQNCPAVLIGREFADPALPDHYIGSEVAYCDLKRVESSVRPNGTNGVHYPLIYSLSMAQADTVIKYLESRPNKGRGSSGFNRQQQQAAAPVQAQSSNEVAELRAMIKELHDSQSAIVEFLVEKEAAAQPAVPVEGHVKVDAPAEPVQTTGPVYRPGDVILLSINGETVARQISDDGKRFNKMIVTK